jgi:hypothetical protein
MRSSWRVNDQGEKIREKGLIIVSGQESGKPFVQTVRSIDNGEFSIEYVAEENKWTQNPRNPVSMFRSIFRPIVNTVTGNFINSPVASPFVEQGVEGGVPIYIVRDKEQQSGTNLRVIFDASNRALRSLDVGSENGGIEIHIFDRKFDETVPESTFAWKAPKDARQVPAGTLKPKMGILGGSRVK